LKKNWPQYELDGLTAREQQSGLKVILPIWHNVSREELATYSPVLAEKLAAHSTDGVEEVARHIMEVLGPVTLPQQAEGLSQETKERPQAQEGMSQFLEEKSQQLLKKPGEGEWRQKKAVLVVSEPDTEDIDVPPGMEVR
jgi:hypothetical protein